MNELAQLKTPKNKKPDKTFRDSFMKKLLITTLFITSSAFCADNSNLQALHFAIYQRSVDTVQDLITRKPHLVNQADNKGRTALFIAALEGHKDTVNALLESGAAVNQANNDDWTPLFIAAGGGHKDIVTILLESGAAVNQATNDGWTPLHLAALRDHKDIVTTLLEAGAAVNQAIYDRTPLYTAANKEHKDVVTVLLKAGALIDTKSLQQMQKKTPELLPLACTSSQQNSDFLRHNLSPATFHKIQHAQVDVLLKKNGASNILELMRNKKLGIKPKSLLN